MDTFNEMLALLTDVGAVSKGAASRLASLHAHEVAGAAREAAKGFTQADIDRAYLNGARDAMESARGSAGRDVAFIDDVLDGKSPLTVNFAERSPKR